MLSSHSADVRATWEKVQDFVNGEQVLVRGDTLDIASVVAVARYITCTFGNSGTELKMLRNGCQPQLNYSSNMVGRLRIVFRCWMSTSPRDTVFMVSLPNELKRISDKYQWLPLALERVLIPERQTSPLYSALCCSLPKAGL